jgi:hypothetical protein
LHVPGNRKTGTGQASMRSSVGVRNSIDQVCGARMDGTTVTHAAGFAEAGLEEKA